MTDPPIRVSITNLAENLAAALTPLVTTAGQVLELAQDVSGIRICGDGLPGEDGVWYRLQPGSGPDDLPVLVLFCHGACFGPLVRVSDSVNPPREIWEQSPVSGAEPDGAEADFSAERSAIFLHHHLLTARDLARGEVVGRNLPAGLAEAFAEAWAVGVDGRLARKGLPGFPLAERRFSFAKVFSPAGILLPDHWQVFQSLWDGAISDQKDVLGVLKWLPGL
jgi:hypothetical protein